ncbi:MAG: hypothetical protein ACKV2T_17825 [Kofleriaceae bacterium]
MTIATAPRRETHPPLARDPAGNLLPLPAGTAAFCFSRETAGRPRKLCGPDKNPLRFPLHTTGEDLVELCGVGVYRVYALDQLGESLADEHVARWDLTPPAREHRNAALDPMLALRADRTSNTSATTLHTDLRFALETMAQMMRTNSDALRLVAESQVDLAKTIATVKGLPRNAARYLPATAPAANDDATDSDEDDDEEEEAQAAPTNPYDLLMPFSEAIAGKVADLIPGFLTAAPGAVTSKIGDAVESGESKPSASKADDLASRGFEARDLFDLDYAHRKGEAKREAKKATAHSTPLQARVMKDPELLRLVIAIKKELPAEETAMLLSAAAKWPEAAQTKFIDTIRPLAVDEALVYCREVIATIREHERGSEGAA